MDRGYACFHGNGSGVSLPDFFGTEGNSGSYIVQKRCCQQNLGGVVIPKPQKEETAKPHGPWAAMSFPTERSRVCFYMVWGGRGGHLSLTSLGASGPEAAGLQAAVDSDPKPWAVRVKTQAN